MPVTADNRALEGKTQRLCPSQTLESLPEFFGFYSSDLDGFTGVGHSIEYCLYKAKWGMKEYVDVLKEQNPYVKVMTTSTV